jgi:hypothetical protein
MNGEPYAWETDEMVVWLLPASPDRAAVEAEAQRVKFEIRPAADAVTR